MMKWAYKIGLEIHLNITAIKLIHEFKELQEVEHNQALEHKIKLINWLSTLIFWLWMFIHLNLF